MKKLIALLLCCTCIALSGCSVEVGDMESEYLTSSFDGTWRQVDYEPNEYLEATINDDTIVINMIYENGRASAVYWYGTIPKLTESVSDYQWVSNSDLSKIHLGFAGVTDNEKHFIYKDGQIWFPYHMEDNTISYTIIMRLERVEE